MRQREHDGNRLHQRAWELLPWYVNDTLTDGERRTVEAHAAACPLCREEIAASRRLAAAVRQVPEVAPSPHPAQLARVLADPTIHTSLVQVRNSLKQLEQRLFDHSGAVAQALREHASAPAHVLSRHRLRLGDRTG